jgi:hypothetical protein
MGRKIFERSLRHRVSLPMDDLLAKILGQYRPTIIKPRSIPRQI